MTLCQYYDKYAKYRGYKCWNTYFALTDENITAVKKRLKREHKSMYPQKLSSKEIQNEKTDTCD